MCVKLGFQRTRGNKSDAGCTFFLNHSQQVLYIVSMHKLTHRLRRMAIAAGELAAISVLSAVLIAYLLSTRTGGSREDPSQQ